MKKMFLRRILSVVLAVLMVLPLFVFNVSADSLTGTPGDRTIIGSERKNWAPQGQTYHTSAWNYDRHSKYLINGTYLHSYQYWQPSDPARPNGAGVDPTKQNFGVSFDNGYYLVDEIVIYANSYERGYNNIKYTVEALILGEWVVVGIGYQDDGDFCNSKGEALPGLTHDGTTTRLSITLKCPQCTVCGANNSIDAEKCRDCEASKSKFANAEFYHCSVCKAISDKNATQCTSCGASKDKLTLKQDINTNNIRIWASEYGSYAKRYGKFENKQPTWHDWWLTPCVQELEVMGVTGYRPEFDVPMNAYLVNNAALSGMIGADSSMNMRYPALGGDDDGSTSWKARNRGAQNIWSEFDKEYPISKVGVNVSGVASADANLTLTYNIKLLVSGTLEDGEWVTVVSGAQVVTESGVGAFASVTLNEPITAKAMMVEITSVKDASGNDGRAVMTELQAEIANKGKCIFLADYITNAKKESTATGNLACFGAAYASSNFSYASISRIANIIDGNVRYDDPAWIAADYLKGTYVGVTLREAHNVTKIALYFNDLLAGEKGAHVFKFEVQAKINGEFVKIAEATSYDAAKDSYNIAIVFDKPVYTDDLRVVFVSDAQTFPYMKEFEIFESGFKYSSYVGYSLDTSRTDGGPGATAKFGDRTVAVRGKYLNKLSPLGYFNIALDHDVDIDWLG